MENKLNLFQRNKFARGIKNEEEINNKRRGLRSNLLRLEIRIRLVGFGG